LLRQAYGCLTPWQDDPAGYGRAALHLNKSPCEEGVLAELLALLDRRLAYVQRDGESFFDATQNARAARGGDAKAVVWAHNSHIGNAAATAMGWQGEFNIGESCRAAFGDSAVLIGFGTDHGTVAAASDWDEPMEIKKVIPARQDSYERVFRQASVPRSLTDWRSGQKSELRNVLSKPRLERAIGVVYRPETEFLSHYF